MRAKHPDPRDVGMVQRVLALVAALFGVVTVFAGTRVLTGADPGYLVWLPLLLYNTVMGLGYVAAGFLAWRSIERGQLAAAAIFTLNLLVLAAVAYLYTAGQAVALDSVRAMLLRTVVWLLLFLGLAWLGRKRRRGLA